MILPVERNRIEFRLCYQLLNNHSFDNTTKKSLLNNSKIIYNKFSNKEIIEKNFCNSKKYKLN